MSDPLREVQELSIMSAIPSRLPSLQSSTKARRGSSQTQIYVLRQYLQSPAIFEACETLSSLEADRRNAVVVALETKLKTEHVIH